MTYTTTHQMLEILLVENSMADARQIIGLLQGSRIRHRLTLIRDGVEAMEFLRREGKFVRAPRPDLVLLDLDLPKKDGWQVLSEINGEYDLHDVPVLIVTDSAGADDRLSGAALGAACFLLKPVGRDELMSAIMQVVPPNRGASTRLLPL